MRVVNILQHLSYCADNHSNDLFRVSTTVGLDHACIQKRLQRFATLEELLAVRRGSGCKNLSDQVYSLLGDTVKKSKEEWSGKRYHKQ